jgi:hypothetical protein
MAVRPSHRIPRARCGARTGMAFGSVSSLHRVTAPFETGGACFLIRRLPSLLLLRRRLLLLLGLCIVLASALASGCNGARRCTRACISSDNLADDRAARCASNTSAGSGASCGGRRFRRRCLLRRLGRIVFALLDSPYVTLPLVLPLLLRRLSFRGIDELLPDSALRLQRECHCHHDARRSRFHRPPLLSHVSPGMRGAKLTR